MSTSTRTPEFGNARIAKPFAGFETKYEGLNTQDNPIAIPGTLDQFAGMRGYDPNLLSGIPMPLGAKTYIWLPRFFPNRYSETVPDYRYRFVWRLRSLAEQVADPTNQRPSHFGRLLPGQAQEVSVSPVRAVLDPTAGPRFVIPAAFESIQIINNKFGLQLLPAGNEQPVQYGTIDTNGSLGTAGSPIDPQKQDPADIAVVAARTNTYINSDDQYQAPISPSYPGPLAPADPKVGAAGLLSQGFYPDQAGWSVTNDASNQGYSAGGQYVLFETEAKGDELIILIDRLSTDADPGWDFSGADRNVSRILGTDAGTRPAIETLGVYIVTGSGVGNGQSFG